MEKKVEGKLVYLTYHVDIWFRELNKEFNIPMANRLAKVVKEFNWNTKEGKLLLKERKKTGKWTPESARDFKYVLRIYYPELKKSANKRVGLEIEEVFPRFYPGTKLSMFEELPPWMLSSLIKEEKNVFRVLKREPQIHSKNVS